MEQQLYMAVTLPDLYPWVMMIAGCISFECLIIGFTAGGSRGKLFNRKMLDENFGDEHKKTFGTLPPGGGYPDHGNGFYGDKLSYKDWFEFQLAQRSH